MIAGVSDAALFALSLVALVVCQRFGELVLARRNTARLIARGGVEFGRRHYPLFILLHGSWLIVCAVLAAKTVMIWWPAVFMFVIFQAGRVWVIATLGPYWTTRVVSVPSAPLVRRGPFRFVRHPNYLVVVGEIATLPLAFGSWEVALVFSIANAALLFHRIRVENDALQDRRQSD